MESLAIIFKKNKQTSKQTKSQTKKTNKPKVASNKSNSTHILQLLSYTQLSLQKAALIQKGHPESTGINSFKHGIFTGINSFKHGIFITQFSFTWHIPSKWTYIEVIIRKYIINQRHVTNVQITTLTNVLIPKAWNVKDMSARREPTQTFRERCSFLLWRYKASLSTV